MLLYASRGFVVSLVLGAAMLVGARAPGDGGAAPDACSPGVDAGVSLQVVPPGRSLLPFVAGAVWLHAREEQRLPVTVEMAVRCTATFDCRRYVVRLSVRTEGPDAAGPGQKDQQDDSAGLGGDMVLGACDTGAAQDGPEHHEGEERQALVFFLPAPLLLACHESGSGREDGDWTFARQTQRNAPGTADGEHRDTFDGCINYLEASLLDADGNDTVLQRSPVEKFTAYEALEAQSLQSPRAFMQGRRTCRGDLPELLHVARGGDADGQGPPSALRAIELGVASGEYSNQVLQSSHTAHLYSVDSWDDEHSGHFIDEYFAVVQAFRRWGQRSTVLRLTFEHAISFFDDGHFDFVYIDGYAHTGQEGGSTIESWYRKVTPGGMLAGHDYNLTRWPLTYHNVNLFANRHNLTVIVTDEACAEDDASWAILVPDEEEMEMRAAALV
jgi:hypothetical protein